MTRFDDPAVGAAVDQINAALDEVAAVDVVAEERMRASILLIVRALVRHAEPPPPALPPPPPARYPTPDIY